MELDRPMRIPVNNKPFVYKQSAKSLLRKEILINTKSSIITQKSVTVKIIHESDEINALLKGTLKFVFLVYILILRTDILNKHNEH